MNPSISCAFDGGNIRLVAIEGNRIDLEIVKDHRSNFFQWFYFRLTGAAGEAVELRILNCAESAYPHGWPGYRACMSHDREYWERADTSYEGGILTIRTTPAANSVWFAYFAPYTMERHDDFIASVIAHPAVEYRSLGQTLDGQEIDYLKVGTGPLQVWLYARQHPGETMAEFWMEGAIEKLLDDADPVSRRLRQKATLHIVPNMNPDGSRRGHLRTNAAGINLNREWHDPSPQRSPEVLYVLRQMDKTGVDFAMDVHGDEAIAANFLAGFEGIPSLTESQSALFNRFSEELVRISPDFQTEKGYEIPPPGQANLSMSTAQLAERFGAVSMTLEMPFKDNDDLPDPAEGWSPDRSRLLGRSCLDALHAIVDELPARR
ncbi:MAG: Zinc carboxypeptidase domain protein [uncultured Sphingosinicella sp.]|uniref:Zinc carboxypeptidase domain protein n=1 Tax=uncultured Sphingosinicella sp. TaxID=478748 RepID=A0A6J4U7S3_9SPHN|nr:M14-type cytosolic carboxypeptidase [uncultured Sphingosinicella sp.]CAA9540473.1 MAG: Zinc carboxypeptidase domain protein [uncultured Sphingosinicella sp.]